MPDKNKNPIKKEAIARRIRNRGQQGDGPPQITEGMKKKLPFLRNIAITTGKKIPNPTKKTTPVGIREKKPASYQNQAALTKYLAKRR